MLGNSSIPCFAGKLYANVQRVKLVHVHRNDVHLRLDEPRGSREPLYESGYQQVGVRAWKERGDDRGDLLACHRAGSISSSGCGV